MGNTTNNDILTPAQWRERVATVAAQREAAERRRSELERDRIEARGAILVKTISQRAVQTESTVVLLYRVDEEHRAKETAPVLEAAKRQLEAAGWTVSYKRLYWWRRLYYRQTIAKIKPNGNPLWIVQLNHNQDEAPPAP